MFAGLSCRLVRKHLPSVHQALGSIPRTKKQRAEKCYFERLQGALNHGKYNYRLSEYQRNTSLNSMSSHKLLTGHK